MHKKFWIYKMNERPSKFIVSTNFDSNLEYITFNIVKSHDTKYTTKLLFCVVWLGMATSCVWEIAVNTWWQSAYKKVDVQ